MHIPHTLQRILMMGCLIVAGETIYSLPFHVARFFRPTFLLAFDFTNTQLGVVQATYGVIAMLAYFPGGPLADRFSALVGMPPLTYLAAWRMQLAKRALRRGRTIAQVAGEVGYDSEAAFSRAFKREVGCAPTIWRQQA